MRHSLGSHEKKGESENDFEVLNSVDLIITTEDRQAERRSKGEPDMDTEMERKRETDEQRHLGRHYQNS